MTYGDDGTRTLKEVRLFEVSLVAVPCAPTAQVTSVKSLSQVERLLAGIKRGDVTGDTLTQLKGIDAALKSLLRKNTIATATARNVWLATVRTAPMTSASTRTARAA